MASRRGQTTKETVKITGLLKQMGLSVWVSVMTSKDGLVLILHRLDEIERKLDYMLEELLAPTTIGYSAKLLASSKFFDREWYLAKYPDVQVAGIDPVKHYLLFGSAEGRDPSPLFNSAWYLGQNPDVRAAGVNPLVHYIRHGATEGREPRHRPTR